MSLIWSFVSHITMKLLRSQKLACSSQRAGLTMRAELPSESPHMERQSASGPRSGYLAMR